MNRSVANLGDVAEAAGVSKSTASRVLNNKLGNGFSVKKEVRTRVLKAAEKLKYRPNLVARGLTQQRNRMISVLGGAHALSDLGNIYQSVVNSITQVMDDVRGGFDVTVDMSHHPMDNSELPAWKIDGAIILAHCSEKTYEELELRGAPYVVINGPAHNGSSVVPDDVQGMKTAIKHLVDLGHKKIAYANAPLKSLSGHRSIRERHDTYVTELKRLGLPVIEGHEIPFSSAVTFLKMSVLAQKATAVIAYGHMNALNIMQAAHLLGISIPHQLSLIAFCDEYAVDIMSPGLTFMDLRAKEMGKLAAQILLEKINDPDSHQVEHVKLSEKLVFRNTTAKPYQN